MRAIFVYLALGALGSAVGVLGQKDGPAPNNIKLRRIESSARTRRPLWTRSLRQLDSREANATKFTNTTFLFNRNYVASITLGGQDFEVMLDTGSSDTWVIKSNFTCLDETGRSAPVGALHIL